MLILKYRKGDINMKDIIDKRGVVVTANQEKKHISQMKLHEVKRMSIIVDDVLDSRLVLINHVKGKIKDHRVVMPKVLIDSIHSDIQGSIIEYNETMTAAGIDKRVLLRSSKYVKVKQRYGYASVNLCMVVSLITGRVITAYNNVKSDNHLTIDFSRYNENLQIIV
jgi:hypothetical protein